MLLPIGAASAALEAIKSLTTPKPSSSPSVGFGPVSATQDSTLAVGFSGRPQLSTDNIGALLAAQSQSTGFHGSDINALLSAPPTFSHAASSAYDAIDQVIQRQGAGVSHPPASLSANV